MIIEFEMPQNEVKQYRAAFHRRDEAVRLDEGATRKASFEKWFKNAILGRPAARCKLAMEGPAQAQIDAEKYVKEFFQH